MEIKVFAVGKVKERAARELCDDYLKRISRYCRVSEQEVRNDEALKSCAPSERTVVALQVGGRGLSSEEFALQLERWGSTGKGQITFIIGGAEGIPPEVDQQAHERLSLSTMTLPHRLARVILLEQIYRGFSILRGEPYAREG